MNLYRPSWFENTIERLVEIMENDLIEAPPVDTGHWQAKTNVPQTATRELMNVSIETTIATTVGAWAAYMRPNLPWAEEHFTERVSGRPVNPPPSHARWPFNQQGNKDYLDGEAFSHSYPERLWPRYAPIVSGELVGGYGDGFHDDQVPQHGIRYPYGDLVDAINLLVREPYTRQCYIPLWFPEDLAAAARYHQRVPCTLGYHMMMRNNHLNCFYLMRSLDLLRYFQDDAYMAGRLVLWLIDECRKRETQNGRWSEVQPGILTMHVTSLHIFEGDVAAIKHRRARKTQKDLA